ncbi:hypothetical protein A2368_02445 [Candidatus Collierbacteria bacterium RIFOXYB1_FULL_49_13]|uniref:Thymidine kinase n=1 Tax=Candidatus Collierbacteria bacterium RIFOXYB1_FULL_49_13 TaxID=1817728 RepID=A0A1F5FBE3_9BACT|nr:MAG: hypothetical protein A2368_02445 [Candidatus Collierbacteria bacterium RIFOXYB1_FULL_49_13]
MSPLKVETGPMFSEKTSTIISGIHRLERAGHQNNVNFLVINNKIDIRYGDNIIGSHKGEKYPALGVADSHQLLDLITQETGSDRKIRPGFSQLVAIFIDEAQFFDSGLPDVLEYLDDLFLQSTGREINIHIAGLDTDFARRPFGPMPAIMSKAIEVNKHTAVCTVPNGGGKLCGQPAVYTQRLVNGEPPNYDDPVVVIGAEETYTARCRHHHVVYNKPKPK